MIRPAATLWHRVWPALRMAACYFSLVHFAVIGFFVEALPSNMIVPVPPHLRWHVMGAHVGIAIVLYAGDRLLSRQHTASWLLAYRAIALSVGLALILRRVELHVPAVQLTVFAAQSLHTMLAVLLRSAVGVAIVVIVVRYQRHVVEGFTYLSVVAVATSVVWATGDLAPDRIYDDYDVTAVHRTESSAPPIVIVVFDELSYEALLDDTGTIDSVRYPHFARLGSESLAFSNASTNYFHTWIVVPTLIDAAVSLAPERDVVLYEQTARIERLYAPGCGQTYTCRGAAYLSQDAQLELSSAVSTRAIHATIPGDLYAPFNRPLGWLRNTTGTAAIAADPNGHHIDSEDLLEELVADIGTGDQSGKVYLLHSMLPHGPYMFDRGGMVERDSLVLLSWSENVGTPRQDVLDAYAEQIEYADESLGRIITALQQHGLYDDATLVVTADHGLRLDGPRDAQADVPVDSMMTRVPLFIRAPSVEPKWTDIDYQHIDFALTLQELAGVETQFPPASSHVASEGVDPVSALSDTRPIRAKTFFVNLKNERYWIYEQPPGAETWRQIEAVQAPIGDRTAEEGLDDLH